MTQQEHKLQTNIVKNISVAKTSDIIIITTNTITAIIPKIKKVYKLNAQ